MIKFTGKILSPFLVNLLTAFVIYQNRNTAKVLFKELPEIFGAAPEV